MVDTQPTELTISMMRQRLCAAVICDALDSLGFRNQSPRVDFQVLTVKTLLVGRCKTTLWVDMAHADPRPYELELKAVDSCAEDDVVIGAASNSRRSGIWGELLSTAARNAGCAGAILDGAVRDVPTMTEMQFPVFARSTSVYDSKDRQRIVDVDISVEIAGVTFRPGDLVFADVDGVVVVPREVEAETVRRAWNKVHEESAMRLALRDGMSAAIAYETFGIL